MHFHRRRSVQKTLPPVPGAQQAAAAISRPAAADLLRQGTSVGPQVPAKTSDRRATQRCARMLYGADQNGKSRDAGPRQASHLGVGQSREGEAGPNRRRQLSDKVVQEAFHVLLKQALVQAEAEGLLDGSTLRASLNPASSEEGMDLQVIAASLALYFAALQARGTPPVISSVNTAPSANLGKCETFVLTLENCPVSFLPFFALWQRNVAKIQACNLDKRHDLALILCERPPQSSPIHIDVANLARDIKRIAIDIVQRQTFQQHFQEDVETAMTESLRTMSADGRRYDVPPASEADAATPAYERESGHCETDIPLAPSQKDRQGPALVMIRETLFAALADCIATYPQLAQMLRSQRQSTDKDMASRAYFASLCMAIVDVSLERVSIPQELALPALKAGSSSSAITSRRLSKQAAATMLGLVAADSSVREAWQRAHVKSVSLSASAVDTQTLVQTNDAACSSPKLSLRNCPSSHCKILAALFAVALHTQQLAAADTLRAIDDVQNGRETLHDSLLISALRQSVLGQDLEATKGTAQDARASSPHVQETALLINKLAMAVFAIPFFRRRHAEIFGILGSVESL